MRNPKIGDIVEITTKRGFAYAQYTQKHNQYGALLRVFGGFYPNRPNSFDEIAMRKPIFECFFPLSAALKRGIVDTVGNVPLPNEARDFPIFRTGVVDPATGKVQTWWLWDGVNEWKVGSLSAEQRKFSVRGVWNDTLLVERIEQGWAPESDPT